MQTYNMTKISSTPNDIPEEEYEEIRPYGMFDTWEEYTHAVDEHLAQDSDHFDPWE